LHGEHEEDTLLLGSLFVQKYNLRIEYLPKGDRNEFFLGYMYTMVEEVDQIQAWRVIVLWVLIFSAASL
jgi:hypothetical protein